MFPIGLFLFSLFLGLVESRTECFQFTGRLSCPKNPQYAANVRIDLMDLDSLPLESDDTMGRAWSLDNGTFQISGCGSDFGPFNTPDPYLKILHKCPVENSNVPYERITLVDVFPVYLPKTMNLGLIRIDENFTFEEIDD